METRIEADSIGTMHVPQEVYYGIQSLRASHNFQMTGEKMHPLLIRSLVQIKKAAALTNERAGLLAPAVACAIAAACDEILGGALQDAFIVDPIQGGAGTSANMNANEVIANRAIELLGGSKGDYALVHPNDHVNMAQSTNDVYPTAGRMAAYMLVTPAIQAIERLQEALLHKAEAFDGILKMGRTQLQDAVPIRLGQSFQAYASMLNRDIVRLRAAQQEMLSVNLGGTAIGTAINTSLYYFENIVETVARLSGLPLKRADDLIDATQNMDSFVSVSGAVKTCALNLSKVANDLRLLSSGPRTGIGEISLPAMQNGSSIMPGKINPVIPEVVTQAAFRIAGNDVTISMAAEAGQLELNAFEPVAFFSLFQSLDLLAHAADTFTENCISGITANEERCGTLLNSSVGILTALCPYIGYKHASLLVKQSLQTGRPLKEILQESLSLSPAQLQLILDPYALTDAPGIKRGVS